MRQPATAGYTRRFIPACAGNRSETNCRTLALAVHPRVCGEQTRCYVTRCYVTDSRHLLQAQNSYRHSVHRRWSRKFAPHDTPCWRCRETDEFQSVEILGHSVIRSHSIEVESLVGRCCPAHHRARRISISPQPHALARPKPAASAGRKAPGSSLRSPRASRECRKWPPCGGAAAPQWHLPSVWSLRSGGFAA